MIKFKCKKPCVVREIDYRKGEWYEGVKEEFYCLIYCNKKYAQLFDFAGFTYSEFNEFFYTIQEVREMEIDKLI